MFKNAESFDQPLNNWDVSNVTNMWSMFDGASFFNQPLNNWDVSNVTSMSEMFWKASSFNQPLDKWDVAASFARRGTCLAVHKAGMQQLKPKQLLFSHDLEWKPDLQKYSTYR